MVKPNGIPISNSNSGLSPRNCDKNTNKAGNHAKDIDQANDNQENCVAEIVTLHHVVWSCPSLAIGRQSRSLSTKTPNPAVERTASPVACFSSFIAGRLSPLR